MKVAVVYSRRAGKSVVLKGIQARMQNAGAPTVVSSNHTFDPTMSTIVLGQVLEERRQQVERWGYTAESDDADTAEREDGRRKRLDQAVKIAFHRRTPYEKRRAEAVIVAAMMVAYVEKLDRAEQRRVEKLKLGVRT